jgi:predicted double-glycine peptidase
VIVLLKVWNGFHYVVVVGTTGTHIVVHDPARGPSRSVPVRKFLDAWEPTGFWALLVLPGRRLN